MSSSSARGVVCFFLLLVRCDAVLVRSNGYGFCPLNGVNHVVSSSLGVLYRRSRVGRLSSVATVDLASRLSSLVPSLVGVVVSLIVVVRSYAYGLGIFLGVYYCAITGRLTCTYYRYYRLIGVLVRLLPL